MKKRAVISLNNIIILSFCLVLFSIQSWAYYPKVETGADEKRTPTRIIIKLRADLDVVLSRKKTGSMSVGNAAYDSLNRRFGVVKQEYLYPASLNHTRPDILKNVFVLEVPHGVDIFQMTDDFGKLDIVEYAEPDWPVELFVAPDDPLYPHQWALNNTGQGYYHVMRRDGNYNDSLVIEYGIADADIDAQEVYDNPPDNTTTVVVAISDTGVDMDHPDLAGRIWVNSGEVPDNGLDDDNNGYIDDIHGWDFSGDSLFNVPEDNDPTDDMGHGTHCAGIVAAVTNNSLGVAGVAADCRIMALNFFPKSSLSLAARSIVYAADNGADVISMSWGTFIHVPAIEDAVAYALMKGVILCAAAGNDGLEIYNYPAACPGVIAVSATNSLDEVTLFSSYGDHLSVCAPGQSILSLRADTTDIYADGGEPGVHIIDSLYYLATGTSMACPYAAAAAAFMRAVSPGLLPAKVKELLELSSDDLLDPYGLGENLPGRDIFSGYGRINLRDAIDAVPLLRAKIISPRPNQIMSGIVDIQGYADGLEFGSYTIEYGPGSNPSDWTEIQTSYVPVTDGLLATLDSDSLNGIYTIRLRVGETNFSQVSINFANMTHAAILSPSANDTVMSYSIISGTATCADFKSFVVEYGIGLSPTDWTEIVESTMPVIEGELTDWLVTELDEGIYTLRLSVFSGSGFEMSDSVNITIRSLFSSEGYWKVALNLPEDGPVIVANYGDFDNDNVNDIVVGTSEGIKFFNPDGTPKTKGVPGDLDNHIFSIPVAVGDLDGDGVEDLVAADNEGYIFGFPSNEQSFAIHSALPIVEMLYAAQEWSSPSVVLKDIDGDNRDEIHYQTGNSYTSPINKYYIYNSDGLLRMEVPQVIDSDFFDYLAADIDGDGVDELYLADDRLFMADIDGGVLDSFDLQINLPGSVGAVSMSAVDIDGDNKLELIVLAENIVSSGQFFNLGTYLIYAFDENLSLKAGWPHDTEIPVFLVPSDVVFGDIDNDNIPEYFVTTYDLEFGYVYAWNIDGTPSTGSNGSAILAVTRNPSVLKSPVIGDIDGNGFSDIIASAAPDVWYAFEYERLAAWNRNGELLSGWPIFIESNPEGSYYSLWRNTITVGDIDRDGLTDLLTTTCMKNNLVFVNLIESPYDASVVPVPFWRYNRQLNNVAPISADFEVIAVSPTKRQPYVPVNTSISITFNRDVNATTIDDETFLVKGSRSGSCQGTITYDNATRTAVFQPSSNFEPQELVTIELTTDVLSSEDYSFKKNFISIFCIEAIVPRVVSTSPSQDETNVYQDFKISVTFNTGMNINSIDNSTFLVAGSHTGTHQGIITYDSLMKTVIFDPLDVFAQGELVTAELNSNIQSINGISLEADYVWSFPIEYLFNILSVNPLPNDVSVPINTDMSVVFDKDIDGNSINDSSFIVYSTFAGRQQGTISYDSVMRTAIFNPFSEFFSGDLVTAVLTDGVQTVDSLVRRNRLLWSFTVGAKAATANFKADSSYSVDSYPYKVYAADLDNDGDLDLVTGHPTTYGIAIFRNNGEGIYSIDTVFQIGLLCSPADIDNDLDVDLISFKYGASPDSVFILMNNGSGHFDSLYVFPFGDNNYSVMAADIDADGFMDLITGSGKAKSFYTSINNGDGTFAPCVSTSISDYPSSIRPGDIDADGDLDLAVCSLLRSVFILFNNGEGSFTADTNDIYDVGHSPFRIIVADLDCDDDIDLSAAHRYSALISVLLNKGDGSFYPAVDYSIDGYCMAMCAADYDGDGDIDLSTSGFNRNISVLLNNGDATFAPFMKFDVGGEAYSHNTADLDGDGDLDIAAGRIGYVSVFFNEDVPTGVDEKELTELPDVFNLRQNYPNPLNPSTVIDFALPRASEVKLEIYNILGRKVITLFDSWLEAGYHSISWNSLGSDGYEVASGIYFYRLTAGDFVGTKKMILLK